MSEKIQSGMPTIKKDAVEKKYVLITKAAPLTYMLSPKGTRRLPLLWFDQSMGANRALRYARNQKSPFEDEQDGFAIVEPIVFEEGLLVAARENQVLQKFLELHPMNGQIFRELDEAKEAEVVIEEMKKEAAAYSTALQLTADRAQVLARVIFGSRAHKMSPSEIKRDLAYYARTKPKQFMDFLNDPELLIRDTAEKALHATYFVLKNGKDVFFNIGENKRKLGSIPFGGKAVDLVVDYLKTDEGIEMYKMINNS